MPSYDLRKPRILKKKTFSETIGGIIFSGYLMTVRILKELKIMITVWLKQLNIQVNANVFLNVMAMTYCDLLHSKQGERKEG